MVLTRELIKNMIPNKKGSIINISSIWGKYGGSCEVAYSASKGGLISFTKALSKELGLSNFQFDSNRIFLSIVSTSPLSKTSANK